jgi:hypothetical protein
MRERKLDRRTRPAKARDQIVALLAADWVAPDAMPAAARLLADRVGALAVRIMLREQRLLREAAQGIDDPASDKGTVQLFNALVRALREIEEMRARHAAAHTDDADDLSTYLATPQAGAVGTDDTSPVPAAAIPAAPAAAGSCIEEGQHAEHGDGAQP